MLDLLLDTRQGATDLVDIGLCLGHRFGGFFAAHAAGFDACFGIALLGNQLLQACLFLIQLLAQALQPTIQAAVFQRLPLGILDPALFLQRLVLLGLPRLALQMRQLLAISSRRSLRRSRFSRVCRIRVSVSLRRSLYLEMPAASSRYTRRSSGRASMIWLIMPCSMIE